ncbi:MAG: selenocysteine-specific translation elongation factor [Pirellulaceae bacterium]
MAINLILGTAGHIDHGKTSLIRALTGTDTDRLPEEKKRGITIELGYAVLNLDDYRLGIVDVPGHEKFVRQMLSGATGMDMALLVIAADDSVKRQTTEHLDILRLLDLPGGVIAITKADVVEAEWLEMVAEEVRELVRGTFLENAPVIPTSAHTGIGLDELKQELIRVAGEVHGSSDRGDPDAPFRMAIDRVFTIEGHGTVVTGSVSSGTVRIGDKLEIQPGGSEVRVREIQNHDLAADHISRGQRGAINLAGVHHAEIKRGQELCSIGHLEPARVVSVNIQMLASASRPLKDRQRMRFHIGTAEVMASVRLLEGKQLEPGDRGLAQLFLSEPVVAVWNQPFVCRTESPMETIGGGRVLHPNASRIRTATDEHLTLLRQLASKERRERVAAALFFDSLHNNELRDLSRIAGVANPEELVAELIADGTVVELPLSPQRTLLVHQLGIEQLGSNIVSYLRRFHEMDPLASGVDRTKLESYFSFLETKLLFEFALKQLIKEKKVNQTGPLYSLEGYGPQLTKNEKLLLNQIVDRFASAGMEPPTMEQLQKDASKAKQSVPQLVQLACDQGQLVKLADNIWMHSGTMDSIKESLQSIMSDGQGITMSDIRQHLNTSRKYAIPICEHLDNIGFTRREGDVRCLA